jgi:hypothetical protein
MVGAMGGKRPAACESCGSVEEGELWTARKKKQEEEVAITESSHMPEHVFYVLAEGQTDPQKVIIDTLEKANQFAKAKALLPGKFVIYLPLSMSCPIYTFFKTQYTFVSDITLCFGASYMRRVLCAKYPYFNGWTSRDDQFVATMPVDEGGVQRIIYYIACIYIAQKTVGESRSLFHPREAIGLLVYRFFDREEYDDIEREVLCCLDYKLSIL